MGYVCVILVLIRHVVRVYIRIYECSCIICVYDVYMCLCVIVHSSIRQSSQIYLFIDIFFIYLVKHVDSKIDLAASR